MPEPVQVVLFDLGGVLTEQGVTVGMCALAGLASEDEAFDRWLTCRWVRSFESGACTASEFAAGVVDDWSLSVSADEFLEAFRGWAIAPFAGSIELVRETATRVRVGCLSNTSAVHWEERVSCWGLAELFEFPILSYRLGLTKPDAEIFELAARMVGCEAQGILLLDDSATNVDAARRAGMRSALVRGVGQSRCALEATGVL